MDEKLRDAERRAASGDRDAAERLPRERLRAGLDGRCSRCGITAPIRPRYWARHPFLGEPPPVDLYVVDFGGQSLCSDCETIDAERMLATRHDAHWADDTLECPDCIRDAYPWEQPADCCCEPGLLSIACPVCHKRLMDALCLRAWVIERAEAKGLPWPFP